ncbi:MAG: heat-inducible transcription repressor HrcA [Clostridiales bacterium]|nr:heat-inducible transcription repressor HrcA [Clostridiales bacterium]
MDDRKVSILTAVVDEYIVTGEPVGSKAVMKYVKASSATIRNEMAELEKQGYLEQPHTSAGRIPTYNGYRLYVDQLMDRNPLSKEEIDILDAMIPEDFTSEDEIIESASAALAEITKCATVVSNSAPRFSIISKVEVIPTGKRMYVILLITSSGSIKNKICRLQFDLTTEQLEFFSNFMAEHLEGIAIDDISDELLERLEEAMGTYMMTLSPLIAEIYSMSQEIGGKDVTMSGEKNLLTCKEFDQNEIITFLDNKKEIAKLLDESFSGLHVMFAPEADSFIINNSSLITSSYEKKGKTAGTLGLIGPMRLDYQKFIPYLEYFTNKITQLMSEDDDEEET